MNDQQPEPDTVPTPEESGEAANLPKPEEIDLAIVAGVFRSRPGAEEQLAYALARYVVLSRMEPGCRNIDLVTSVTMKGVFMVWEKWEHHDAQRAHLDGEAIARLAEDLPGIVDEPPSFDLFDAISAHDLV